MAGCTTVQYTLPKRHLFRDTDQVPDIMDNVLAQRMNTTSPAGQYTFTV